MCNEGKRIASAKEGEDAPLVAKWSSVKSRRVESMYLFNLFDRGRKPSRRFGDNRSHLPEPNASRSARADFSFPTSPLSQVDAAQTSSWYSTFREITIPSNIIAVSPTLSWTTPRVNSLYTVNLCKLNPRRKSGCYLHPPSDVSWPLALHYSSRYLHRHQVYRLHQV